MNNKEENRSMEKCGLTCDLTPQLSHTNSRNSPSQRSKQFSLAQTHHFIFHLLHEDQTFLYT